MIQSFVIFPIIKDLLLATVLGVLIGLERKIVQGEAGMRTFGLISLGSALFLMIGRVPMTIYSDISNADSLRILGQIIGQIVVGIGFLGAGVIIFQEREGKVKGLTTAAVMWVTAAIGAAVGLQLYDIAIIATIFVLLINTILLPIEKRIDKKENEKK